jgi:hypothetical protein
MGAVATIVATAGRLDLVLLGVLGAVAAFLIKAAHAAIARLEELSGEDWVREETAGRMRAL